MTTHTLPPEVTLAPCPFCGAAAYLIKNPRNPENENELLGPALVQCWECDASQMSQDEDEAIAAWNRRAEPSGEGVGAEPVAWLALAGENKSRCLCWTEGVALSEADGDRSRIQPLYAQPLSGMEGVTEDQAAYGLLWRMHTTDQTIHSARHALLDKIGKDGQRAGLAWALKAFGPNPIPTTEEMP